VTFPFISVDALLVLLHLYSQYYFYDLGYRVRKLRTNVKITHQNNKERKKE
jgi:hypothetical protein